MKIAMFFKTKIGKRVVLFYIFINIIDTGLIKDSWILTSPSAFKLLQGFFVVVVVKVYEEN